MATATARKTPTKKVSHAKPAVPPEIIANIVLIDRDRIRVRAQVRDEFDDDFIASLAASIEARGLRTPIEVSPYGDELYDLTLGENRLRACDLLKLSKIPCIITKVSEEDRLIDQLTENIHRKDLSIANEAAAVRKIYDRFSDLEATAKYIGKPKPWVSKRLALTHPNFSWRAKMLMEQHFTEDVELLNVVSQIEKVSNDYRTKQEIFNAIADGKMNRDQAREKLKDLKARQAQSRKDQAKEAEKRKAKAEKAAAKEDEKRKLREEGTGPEFIQYSLENIQPYSHHELQDVDAFISSLTSDQRQTLEDYLNSWCEKGRSCAWAELQACFRPWSPTTQPIERLAMIMGMRSADRLHLMTFVTLIHSTE